MTTTCTVYHQYNVNITCTVDVKRDGTSAKLFWLKINKNKLLRKIYKQSVWSSYVVRFTTASLWWLVLSCRVNLLWWLNFIFRDLYRKPKVTDWSFKEGILHKTICLWMPKRWVKNSTTARSQVANQNVQTKNWIWFYLIWQIKYADELSLLWSTIPNCSQKLSSGFSQAVDGEVVDSFEKVLRPSKAE